MFAPSTAGSTLSAEKTQTKIRGQGVEAGQIEHHMAIISGLTACAVVFPGQGCFSGEMLAVVQMGKLSPPPDIGEGIGTDLDQPLPVDTVRTPLPKVLQNHTIQFDCLTIYSMQLGVGRFPELKV